MQSVSGSQASFSFSAPHPFSPFPHFSDSFSLPFSFLSPRSGVRGLYAHTVRRGLQPGSGHPAAICVRGGAAEVQTHPAETHCKVTQAPPQTPLQAGVENCSISHHSFSSKTPLALCCSRSPTA